jgi:hypothetical protein
MSHDLDKKFEAYEERIKDLEEKYLHTLGQLDRFQTLMWDVENQNCEYEDRFQKIAEAALTKWNNPSMSFYNGGNRICGSSKSGPHTMRKMMLLKRNLRLQLKLGGVYLVLCFLVYYHASSFP